MADLFVIFAFNGKMIVEIQKGNEGREGYDMQQMSPARIEAETCLNH